MVRIPTNRQPTHPGEMLVEEFLTPMHITQRELADAIHVPYQRVNELVNQKRGVTPSTALRLARFFSAMGKMLEPYPSAALKTRPRLGVLVPVPARYPRNRFFSTW